MRAETSLVFVAANTP